MYRFVNLLAIVLMTGLMASTVQAAEVSADDAEESFNIMGYAILGFALIGWTFFLGLLGGAILHIVKKARKPYTPKNPVKCKSWRPSPELNRLLCLRSVLRTPRAGRSSSTIPPTDICVGVLVCEHRPTQCTSRRQGGIGIDEERCGRRYSLPHPDRRWSILWATCPSSEGAHRSRR